MFEEATRKKIRFETVRGRLSVEDLWDLPLTSARGVNLNDIAKGLNRELKDAAEEDFVNRPAQADTTVDTKLAFEIVKHIINVRLVENETARMSAERREKKQRLLELIARKQDENLAAKSVEELTEMVEAL